MITFAVSFYTSKTMRITLLFFYLLIVPLLGLTQESDEKADTIRKDALNVFMETSDYLRREIPL